MNDKLVIRDRKTIYEKLSEICDNCGHYYPDDYYCEYQDQVFEDETEFCLVHFVSGNLGDWDWPDREDLTIDTSEKRTPEDQE